MAAFEIGVVLPLAQSGPERRTVRWTEIRDVALRCEALGFDTLWTPDELTWFIDDAPPLGAWEGVSMAGAVAAVTSRAAVGTWVLSALHRNPAIIAKTVEALDEISGGRFVFGLGAGHTWPRQASAFGLPEDHVFDRFEEALAIIVPMLREGRADVEGRYYAARALIQQPVGPRPGGIPLMIGGNGPKGQRHAVRHADIWSGWAEHASDLSEFGPRLEALLRICEEEGRDPATIGRSAGLDVRPLDPVGARPGALSGSAEAIADAVRTLREAGYTRVEFMVGPATMDAFEAVARVVELVHVDGA